MTFSLKRGGRQKKSREPVVKARGVNVVPWTRRSAKGQMSVAKGVGSTPTISGTGGGILHAEEPESRHLDRRSNSRARKALKTGGGN